MSGCWCALAILAVLLTASTPVQAATGYEVSLSSVGFDPAVTTDKFVQMRNDNLQVTWTAPTATGDIQIMGYVLKFNESTQLLSSADFSDADGTYDYLATHVPELTQQTQLVPQSFFVGYDSDKLRYLHIKTMFFDLNGPNGPGNYFSDDVVIDPAHPIRIDNVAPTGTLVLNPTSGSSLSINATMSAGEVIKNYWRNYLDARPASAGTACGSTTCVTTDPFPVPDSPAYGPIHLYAWFEDNAGNITTAHSATADYNYTAPLSIQYNTAPIEINGTRDFSVDGVTSYTWTITDANPADVAEFSGGGTAPVSGTSVTVVGKKAGTFTVTATLGGTVLTTSAITVNPGRQRIPLRKGWNLISFGVNKCFYTGTTQPTAPMIPGIEYVKVNNIADILISIDGQYSYVRGYDTVTTPLGFKNYIPGLTPTLKYMAAGYGYWIKVKDTANVDQNGLIYLEIEGPRVPANTPVPLAASAWNLVGYLGNNVLYTGTSAPTAYYPDDRVMTPTSSVADIFNSISGRYSYVRGYDTVTNPLGFKNYIPGVTPTLKYTGPGYGYWIKVNAGAAPNLTWGQ